MPSKSEAQRRLMAAVAGDPNYGKKVGIAPSVAKEFQQADRAVAREVANRLRKRGTSR